MVVGEVQELKAEAATNRIKWIANLIQTMMSNRTLSSFILSIFCVPQRDTFSRADLERKLKESQKFAKILDHRVMRSDS